MVNEISNKTLAILLIAAIAISLGGTIFSLNRLASVVQAPSSTGYVTNPTGQAKINVTSVASLRFSVAMLDFGIGYVNTSEGNQYCSMSSNNSGGTKDGSARCVNFNAANTFISLELENDGNNNLTLSMDSDKDAGSFLGGTLPGFKFYVTNNETGACPDPDVDSWTDVSTDPANLCSNARGISFVDSADSMDLHLNLTIPYNSYSGEQIVTFTVTGTSV